MENNIINLSNKREEKQKEKIQKNIVFASIINAAIKNLKGIEHIPEAKETKIFLENKLYNIKSSTT